MNAHMSCAPADVCHIKPGAPLRHEFDSGQARLTVENDDRASMYSVRDLLRLHDMCTPQLPIVFDFHHWRFCTGALCHTCSRAYLQNEPDVVLITCSASLVHAGVKVQSHYLHSLHFVLAFCLQAT